MNFYSSANSLLNNDKLLFQCNLSNFYSNTKFINEYYINYYSNTGSLLNNNTNSLLNNDKILF